MAAPGLAPKPGTCAVGPPPAFGERLWLNLISALSDPECKTMRSESIRATFQPSIISPKDTLVAGDTDERIIASRRSPSMMMPTKATAGGDVLDPENVPIAIVVSAAIGARARSKMGRALISSKFSLGGG
jgi:hypothetical protein